MTAQPTTRPQDLADQAVALVERWIAEAAEIPADAAAERLAGVLRDPHGLDFTVGFVDGVVRPEDLSAAAKQLRALTPLTPQFLPAALRGAISVGGAMAPALPALVVPLARRVLRQMVSHLIIDASEAKLGPAIAKITRDDVRLNINLLGEAILGEQEAARRLAGTHQLLQRPDVDYVSIKVSSTVAPHNHWAFDEAVARIEDHLLPLFARAAAASPHKFINLDMEEYKDLDLTLAVFTSILDRPEFAQLEAGIVLQAYLPDALRAMIRLQHWSATRVARGGAPIKVRVVKGANLPMELVDAALHGWPAATWGSKQETDTSYKAVLDYALHPERVRNVRVGVAGHNLFDVALAWLLAQARGAESGIEFEMLLGMATGQAEAVKREVGSLLLYTPVVHPREFDVAIAYLIRRLEEGASQENFMSAVFEIDENRSLFERERDRFLASLEALDEMTGGAPADSASAERTAPLPHRRQDRRRFDAAGIDDRVAERIAASRRGEFTNVPDTDPDLPGNRLWGLEIADRMVASQLGAETVAAATVPNQTALNTVITHGVTAATAWQALGAEKRAEILYRAGELLEAKRAALLEVMGSECAKTLDQGDPEVSEAIDFANYYAMLGQLLEQVDGAVPQPVALTAVIPPWNFPVAIPAGGTLAALAAGSAVILKPAQSAARSGAVLVEALWEAGVPRDVLQLVQFRDRGLGSALVADSRVDRLILTGAYETAARFRELRADLPLLAETSGKNAIIVTPNADLDLAARDVAQSAFGHAGQKCSAASLVILVGSVAQSARFRAQLLDAVSSLRVGTPDQLTTQMGPIIAAPSGKLLRGLTTLGAGERWLIPPEPISSTHPLAVDSDGTSKLWRPGVRAGVQRGSEYHLTEYFGPILGIMTAETLDEAIDMVNEIDYGLTSGLHSLDSDELATWLRRIEAGNLYVNRGITGAIVRRQSFGGWKKSAIGAGTKAGGPSYLHGLVNWADAPVMQSLRAPLPSVAPLLTAAQQSGLTGADLAWLRAALGSDAAAWEDEFGIARDASQLGVERNVLRYFPVAATLRIAEDAPLHEAVRAISAAVGAGAHPVVSTAQRFPEALLAALGSAGVSVHVESAAAWAERVAELAAQDGPAASARIRLVAGASRASEAAAVSVATGGKPDVAIYAGPVVAAGRVELLPHLREQAVSITAHRFGTPTHLSDGLL
ncbi:L-proline dehydrogenase /delta-1-pyrroline-5-carboxylate dehydrogenase [Leucobacter luti]|uniref:proline dehydrogenase family protein n=1 Tax=Leucobacter luti TaxID=340320 RepID=UPI0010473A6E|nr:bifunctional proline dehydrogenase/L-glutamate gamma-semialdehyde dehydrogenase [Leucobacter luti]MCW2289807.1 RHH-type proline utilization regulon transcriptional repressor/proline dehydrogenase/delta 1-pyrroline-5-carboxylate dehydrogenase [Leucobacter luti]TCK34343.1 L-proline dehydrogenase /delta-1-pyrroline-5-carboxylate dehydrogenase [Leucobacter luti]